jgi:hypothetical protein
MPSPKTFFCLYSLRTHEVVETVDFGKDDIKENNITGIRCNESFIVLVCYIIIYIIISITSISFLLTNKIFT